MGRRRAFDAEVIGRAALRVLDRDGASGLTMRAVADELGTGAMTLYNYVEDRAQLEGLVVDAALAGVRLPARARGQEWQDRVHAIGMAVGRAVSRHPDVAPLVLTRRSMSPGVLRPAEDVLDALHGAGLRGAELLAAFRAVLATVMGVIQADLAGPMSTRSGDPKTLTVRRFEELDPVDFPRLIELAATARRSSLTTELDDALAIVIAGIESRRRTR